MDNIIKLINLKLIELSNTEFEDENELDFLCKYMDYYVLDLKNIKRFHRLNNPPFLGALLMVNTDLTFQEIDDLITPVEPLIEKLPNEDIFCRALVIVTEILYDLGYDEMLKTGCDVPPFNDKKFLDFILKINNRDVFRYFASFLQVKGMCENIYYMSNNNDMEYKLLLKEIKQSPLYNDLFKFCYDNTQRRVKELKKNKRDFLKRKQNLINLYKQLKSYINTNDYIEYKDYFDDLEDDFKIFLYREMLLHNKSFYDKAQNDISMIDNNIEAIFKINGFDFNNIGEENQNRLNNGNIDNIKQLLKVINTGPFYISDNNSFFTDILLCSDINIFNYIKSLCYNEWIDTSFIHNNISILLSNEYQSYTEIPCLYERFCNNIYIFINKKFNIKNIRKSNPSLFLIDENILKQRLFLFKQYHVNFDKQDNIDYNFITNYDIFNIMDSFIELGLNDYVKNNIEMLSSDGYNIIKRIYISNIIGYNIWNENGKLNNSILTGFMFPISNDDLENYYINYTDYVIDNNITKYFGNNYGVSSIINILDNYYLVDDNYLFDDIIISRNKVIRNISSISLKFENIDSNILLMAIINNSILDENQIETIKYEINKILSKKQKTL